MFPLEFFYSQLFLIFLSNLSLSAHKKRKFYFIFVESHSVEVGSFLQQDPGIFLLRPAALPQADFLSDYRLYRISDCQADIFRRNSERSPNEI